MAAYGRHRSRSLTRTSASIAFSDLVAHRDDVVECSARRSALTARHPCDGFNSGKAPSRMIYMASWSRNSNLDNRHSPLSPSTSCKNEVGVGDRLDHHARRRGLGCERPCPRVRACPDEADEGSTIGSSRMLCSVAICLCDAGEPVGEDAQLPWASPCSSRLGGVAEPRLQHLTSQSA